MQRGKIKVLQIGCENFGAGGRSVIIYNLTEKMGAPFRIDFLSCGKVRDEQYLEAIGRRGGKIKEYISDETMSYLHREMKRTVDLTAMLLEEQYDIVHVNADDAWEAAKSVFIARRAGVKHIIVHAHTTGTTDSFCMAKKMVVELAKIYINFTTEKKLCCSREAALYLFGKRMEKKAVVLKNGIDFDKFAYNPKLRVLIREKMGYGSEKLVLGCVGRLSPPKNPFFMLEIVKRLADKGLDIVLLWAGTGELKKAVEDRIDELKIKDQVALLGARNDVNELLQGMDIFILPSLYEGFGIVNLEAQASGLPCVVSTEIPESVVINNNFYRISLKKGVNYWADFIANMDIDRKTGDLKKIFWDRGYDIRYSTNLLKEWYKELIGDE